MDFMDVPVPPHGDTVCMAWLGMAPDLNAPRACECGEAEIHYTFPPGDTRRLTRFCPWCGGRR